MAIGNSKLIRDFMAERWPNNIYKVVTAYEEKKQYVADKLKEECDELLHEFVNDILLVNFVEEVADVLEVIHEMCRLKQVSLEEVEKIRLRKLEERGGFRAGIVWNDLTNEEVEIENGKKS